MRGGSILKRAAVFVLVLGGIWALWEGYRWLWLETGWTKPFTVNQYTLPHLHDIVLQLGEPTSTGDDLWLYLFHAALFTARAAAVGFLFGAVIGFTLGVVLAQFDVLRRGVMPYVVASQTIPILALAPIVVRGLGSVTHRRVAASGLGARVRHRGVPHVLPRDREHPARTALA